MQALPTENIDPSVPTIFVRRLASTISDDSLLELRVIAARQANTSDCLRDWLRECVDQEIARRQSCRDDQEPGVWGLPWHEWNDEQLRCALITSFSWYDVGSDPDSIAVIREVLRACVTAAATRLGELHLAIENARGANAI